MYDGAEFQKVDTNHLKPIDLRSMQAWPDSPEKQSYLQRLQLTKTPEDVEKTFTSGSPDDIVDLIFSYDPDRSSRYHPLRIRVVSLAYVIATGLCYLRDEIYGNIDLDDFKSMLDLTKIIDLANPDCYPDPPVRVILTCDAYLRTLPGYNPILDYKQDYKVFRHHQGDASYLSNLLGYMQAAMTYGSAARKEF